MLVTEAERAVERALAEYLGATAERADRLRADAARSLVTAASQAATHGWSQRRIAAAMGRSQPEVARLLGRVDRVRDPAVPEGPAAGPAAEPESMLGRVLGTRRDAIVAAAERSGVTNVRVFGSVARGEDGPDSDVDLLVDVGPEVGLMDLVDLELEIAKILGRPVDVANARALRPAVAATVEAVAL
ncbi:hypothetical protein EBM89_14535 [Cellulomonas triticagri]|uniref:Polymerase nucleotidyl transferase domain-containing protein n=2 Tax=Cellulomonas triticagri TaxID=2483352 RepID=A0A3M2IYE9_9CELL|nr:hypothetical protein EBM89_14535 [Cellulomonas triticagri]